MDQQTNNQTGPMFETHGVIARFPKCRGELGRNGLCPNADCTSPGELIDSLRRTAMANGKVRTPRRVPARSVSRPAELPLSGQDAALPVGDRD